MLIFCPTKALSRGGLAHVGFAHDGDQSTTLLGRINCSLRNKPARGRQRPQCWGRLAPSAQRTRHRIEFGIGGRRSGLWGTLDRGISTEFERLAREPTHYGAAGSDLARCCSSAVCRWLLPPRCAARGANAASARPASTTMHPHRRFACEPAESVATTR
jgi:hypothetical protein